MSGVGCSVGEKVEGGFVDVLVDSWLYHAFQSEILGCADKLFKEQVVDVGLAKVNVLDQHFHAVSGNSWQNDEWLAAVAGGVALIRRGLGVVQQQLAKVEAGRG